MSRNAICGIYCRQSGCACFRRFPSLNELIAAALGAQRPGGLVADGEVVALEGRHTRFGRLQQRLGVVSPGEKLPREFPVYLYLFNLLHAGGRDTRLLPLTERKKPLAHAVDFRDPLRCTEDRERDVESCFEQACRDGREGLITKRADAPYPGGRSRDWLSSSARTVRSS